MVSVGVKYHAEPQGGKLYPSVQSGVSTSSFTIITRPRLPKLHFHTQTTKGTGQSGEWVKTWGFLLKKKKHIKIQNLMCTK